MLVAREFTAQRVEELRPAITAMVDAILDRLGDSDGDGGDMMDLLAFPLKVKVSGELLGVPDGDREQFRWIVRHAAGAVEPMASAEAVARAEVARTQMNDYFRDLLAEPCKSPTDDLIGALIRVRDGSDRLTENELIATIILLSQRASRPRRA